MLKLNSDLGEGIGNEARIMPLIDQANIACGGHAGDEETMRECVRLAREHGVEIGAHPGYPDRENFGRRSMQLEEEQLRELLAEQIGRLREIARAEGVDLAYVKPHGALYNDMMRDPELFERIVAAVAEIDPKLRLMILSTPEGERYEAIARRYGIGLIHELFADRHYTPEGKLVPRSEPDAVIHDPEDVLERIRHYRERGHLLCRKGTPLKLRGDSLCVHGDNPEAIALVEALRGVL